MTPRLSECSTPGIIVYTGVTPGYCVRGPVIIGGDCVLGDSCSRAEHSLVTRQRRLFVLTTKIPPSNHSSQTAPSIERPGPHSHDIPIDRYEFSEMLESWNMHALAENIRFSPESRCSFRSNHFHLHCQDFFQILRLVCSRIY